MTPLAERLAGKDLLLDTNLLLLLTVGLVRPESVGGRRLEQYTLSHFHILCETVISAGRVILTPHVLAETSNLIKAALYGEPLRNALTVLMLDQLRFGDNSQSRVVLERPTPKVTLDRNDVYRLGVADAGLLCAAAVERTVLVTADFDLYSRAMHQGIEAENFNYVWND